MGHFKMADTKKFDEIQGIPDEVAFMHRPHEYTYIANAEKYQKTGELEVKRVLKKDLCPEASASYVFFKREGCKQYPLVEKDLYLKSPNGYVGPFQMDGKACNAFLQHIETEHPEWKKYINGKGTAGYMNFVKKCPDKEALLKNIEQYALSDYFNNRVGKPEVLAANLAKHFNMVDANGAPDATRIPLHVIASMPTGVIARGNGKKFNKKIPTLNEKNIDAYCKAWISDNNRGVPAYNELKKIDYLTPEIIAQYQTMNLAGSSNLQEQFQTIVAQKEHNKELAHEESKKGLKIELLAMHPEPPKLEEIPELYGRRMMMDLKTDKRKKKRKQKEAKKQQTATNINVSALVMQNQAER